MDTGNSDKPYEVVFSGTDAEGERKFEVMRHVQRTLKISEHQLVGLFNQSEDVVLLKTADRGKAERLIARLKHAGARASLRDTASIPKPDWQDWELQDARENGYHTFQCHACNHAVRLPLSEPLPPICPECRVVAAKYHDVAQKKREREQVRRKVLDLEQAKFEQKARVDEIAREAALRKKIEREVRRELGLEPTLGKRLKTSAAVIATFAFGAASTVAYHSYQASIQQEPMMATAIGDKYRANPRDFAQGLTIRLADQTIRELGSEPPSGPSAIPANGLAGPFDPEPWLTAPPTAAGAAPAGQFRRNTPARGQNAATVSDDDFATIVTHWHEQRSAAPLNQLRLQRLLGRLIETGRIEQAVEMAMIGDSADERLDMLLQIALGLAPHDQQTRREVARRSVSAALADAPSATAPLVEYLALLALQDTPAQRLPDRPSLHQAALQQAAGPTQQIALYAQLAAHLAERGEQAAAERWFAEANGILQNLDHPLDELVAVARLARAYYRANDRAAAESLVERVQTGTAALANEPDALLFREMSSTYATLGRIDAANATARQAGRGGLGSELRRADLAVHLNASGQGIAARGIVTELNNPVIRARTQALLSSIEQIRGQLIASLHLAIEARPGARLLHPELAQLVDSDLGRKPRQLPVADASSSQRTDRQLAMIALNMGWHGAFEEAGQAAGSIGDRELRGEVEQRLGLLQQTLDVARRVQVSALDRNDKR